MDTIEEILYEIESVKRAGFYGPTVQAEYEWHEECSRNPLALQQRMLDWGMPHGS